MHKSDPDAPAYFNSWTSCAHYDGWLKERRDYWFRGNDCADLVS